MARGRHMLVNALVLRSFDVGEADRFCILLTREHGRLAARAAAARKTGSRMGGVLLPLSRVRAEIVEHASGHIIRSVVPAGVHLRRDAAELAVLQEGVEMVLRLTDDHQELPDVFDACEAFLAKKGTRHELVAFTARLLCLLGILPLTDEDVRFAALTSGARRTLASYAAGHTEHATALTEVDGFLTLLLCEHLRTPLSSTAVRLALA